LEIFLIAYPMPLALQGFYGLSLYAYIAPITIYSLLSSYGLVCKSCIPNPFRISWKWKPC